MCVCEDEGSFWFLKTAFQVLVWSHFEEERNYVTPCSKPILLTRRTKMRKVKWKESMQPFNKEKVRISKKSSFLDISQLVWLNEVRGWMKGDSSCRRERTTLPSVIRRARTWDRIYDVVSYIPRCTQKILFVLVRLVIVSFCVMMAFSVTIFRDEKWKNELWR
jgi:hypothetical protein